MYEIRMCDTEFAEFLQIAHSARIHSSFSRALNIFWNHKLYTILDGFLDSEVWSEEYLGIPQSAYGSGQTLEFGKIQPGEEVFIEKNRLYVGQSVQIIFDRLSVFPDTFFQVEPAVVTDEIIKQGIVCFDEWMRKSGKRDGAADFYRTFYLRESVECDMFQEFFHRRLKKLPCFGNCNESQWCELFEEAAHCLLGAGKGLTPSGDDFLCGYLTAVSSVKNDRAKDVARSLEKVFVLGINQKLTTRISCEMLRFHLNGKVTRLEQLLQRSFLEKGNGMEDILEKLALVGHTSGLDMACGMACGMRTIINV